MTTPHYVTHDDFMRYLTAHIRRAGSQAAFARKHSLSPAYLSDVLGGKRDPGAKILDAVGVERVVLYRKKTSP